MTLPPARSRQRGIATTEIGIVSVILLIVGVLFYRGCAARSQPALECLRIAAQIGGGARPEGSTCPVSQAPFVAPVCPDPGRHLRWPPRFDRSRWQQDVPASTKAASLEIGRKTSYITAREDGAGLIVDVRPRIWWRYIVGPLVQLLCVVYIVAFFFQLRPKDRGPGGIVVMSVVAALVSVWLLWITVPTVEGSHAFEFSLTSGKITRHRYLFGRKLAPEIYAPEALACVRTRTGWSESYSLVMVHRPAGEARTMELIDGLSEEDAVLDSWLRARFILLR